MENLRGASASRQALTMPSLALAPDGNWNHHQKAKGRKQLPVSELDSSITPSMRCLDGTNEMMIFGLQNFKIPSMLCRSVPPGAKAAVADCDLLCQSDDSALDFDASWWYYFLAK
jgi:hypothetical protein